MTQIELLVFSQTSCLRNFFSFEYLDRSFVRKNHLSFSLLTVFLHWKLYLSLTPTLPCRYDRKYAIFNLGSAQNKRKMLIFENSTQQCTESELNHLRNLRRQPMLTPELSTLKLFHAWWYYKTAFRRGKSLHTSKKILPPMAITISQDR